MMRLLTPATLLAAALSIACGGGTGQPQMFVTVLTGNTSGVYYPLGVGLSQLFRQAVPEANVAVQATAASAENLHLLEAARGEIGFTLADVLADAWEGRAEAGFGTPLKKLRAIAGIYPNYMQIVASAASGVQTLGRPEGQARIGRRARVRNGAQRARDREGRRPHLRRLLEGRVPLVQ